ncbi:MAG TPA: hypothetical protein VOA87_11780 [Thermoanaerobaculia bacterium]|nr:hypothetical protein [Thermoanaerobaculia bacterium]
MAIGLRAKSGRAIAVILRGPLEKPIVLAREELVFTIARLRQPFHAVLDLPWEEASAAVRPVAAQIAADAGSALKTLLEKISVSRKDVLGVGVVGAGVKECGRIGNPHIRAHAAEGVLFRKVLEGAARENGLTSVLFPERSLYVDAASTLGMPEAALKALVAGLGRVVGPPWRGDEKAAAAAALAVLGGRSKP